MTVQELIDKLQKVEDKTQKIYVEDSDWGAAEVEGILIYSGKLCIL